MDLSNAFYAGIELGPVGDFDTHFMHGAHLTWPELEELVRNPRPLYEGIYIGQIDLHDVAFLRCAAVGWPELQALIR